MKRIDADKVYIIRPEDKNKVGGLVNQYDNDFCFAAFRVAPKIQIDNITGIDVAKELSDMKSAGNQNMANLSYVPYDDCFIIKSNSNTSDSAKQLLSIYSKLKKDHPQIYGSFCGNYEFQHIDAFYLDINNNCSDEKKEEVINFLKSFPYVTTYCDEHKNYDKDYNSDLIQLHFDDSLSFKEISDTVDKINSYVNDIAEDRDIEFGPRFTESSSDGNVVSFDLDLDEYLANNDLTEDTTEYATSSTYPPENKEDTETTEETTKDTTLTTSVSAANRPVLTEPSEIPEQTAATVEVESQQTKTPAKNNQNLLDDTSSKVYGDVDGSGTVNVADAVLLNKAIVGAATISVNSQVIDCIQDGNIDSKDSAAILAYLSGSVPRLPIEHN